MNLPASGLLKIKVTVSGLADEVCRVSILHRAMNVEVMTDIFPTPDSIITYNKSYLIPAFNFPTEDLFEVIVTTANGATYPQKNVVFTLFYTEYNLY